MKKTSVDFKTCTPMDEETLGGFNLTPSEIDTFTALQSFNDCQEAASPQPQQSDTSLQQEQQHQSQQQQQYHHQQEPSQAPPLYFDLIDPILLSQAGTPTSHPSPALTSQDQTFGQVQDVDSSPFGLDIWNTATSQPFPPSPQLPQSIPLQSQQTYPSSFPHSKHTFPSHLYHSSNPFDPTTSPSTYNHNHNHNLFLRHQRLGHRRSVSVPPEELLAEEPQVTFTRGSTPLGRSTQQTPKKLLRSAQKKRVFESGDGDDGGGRGGKRGRYEIRRANTTGGVRAAPSGAGDERGGGGMGGPTSAPSPLYYPPEMHAPLSPHHSRARPVLGSRARHPDQSGSEAPASGLRVSDFTPHASHGQFDQMTEVERMEKEREKAWFDRVDVRELIEAGISGDVSAEGVVVFARLENLAREIEGVKKVLREKFCGGVSGGVMKEEEDNGGEKEKGREKARAANALLLDLDDELEMVPLAGGGEGSKSVAVAVDDSGPLTGRAIRDMTGGDVGRLLKIHGLSCPKGMFFYEKKVVLLKCFGVGRELMHKILD